MVNIVTESPDEGSLNKVCVYVFMYVICKSHTARVRITKDHRIRLFKLSVPWCVWPKLHWYDKKTT